MIDYNAAPEHVRALALIFLQALVQPAESLPPKALLALGKEARLPFRKLLAAARWLAKHYGAKSKRVDIIEKTILRTAAARWEAYVQELEKLAAADE
jgi:hypothetical protein